MVNKPRILQNELLDLVPRFLVLDYFIFRDTLVSHFLLLKYAINAQNQEH
jgi:hypothetical protein